jgi:lipopolysaccharide export system protein LptA
MYTIVKRFYGICFLLLAAVSLFSAEKILFSADRMSGGSGKKNSRTVLEGSASVSIGTLTITASRIELSGEDFRFVTADGGVLGTDTDKGFSFNADELSYDRETEVAIFRGKASLSDTKHNVETSAGIITYNRKSEVAWLQTDVKLKKDKISCAAGFALYRRTLSTLELTGAPVVKRDTDEFRADRISVNLDTERITLDGAVSGTLKEEAKPGDTPGTPKEGDPKTTVPTPSDAGAGAPKEGDAKTPEGGSTPSPEALPPPTGKEEA